MTRSYAALGCVPASTDDLSLPDDLVGLSIYATLDGLMTGTEAIASRSLMPALTCWKATEGGNHAQFGEYGVQARDATAAISAVDKPAQVVGTAVRFMELLAVKDVDGMFTCDRIGTVQ